VNQLCRADTAGQLLESIAFRHERNDWYVDLALLMPDHVHLIASFPRDKSMDVVVREWKKFVARSCGIRWQRDFFDHRLRGDEGFAEKATYIESNPVRAGLVSNAADWPYVWRPKPLW
jgi:REP element-mobilizing transposase RayT